MEYVVVRWEREGTWLDPAPYLDVLPAIADNLPPGAREFAQAPGHYDFYGTWCVKDLRPVDLCADDADRRMKLAFEGNPFKHSKDLTIVYSGIKSVLAADDRTDPAGWLGTVLLDEVLPVEGGVSHEIVLSGGTIKIVAGDMEARWHDRGADRAG